MRTLTVVVATFNRSRLLLNLFADLARQDLVDPASGAPAFDLILVDDGSREPARAALAGQTFPFRYQLIEQANAGAAAARDRGIRAASGEVIVIVDDDMQLPTGFLRAHLAAHEAGKTLVLGCIRSSDALASMPLFERFHAWQLEQQRAAATRGEPVHGAALCTGNVSFRREAYLRVGGFDPALQRSEDRDLGIRLEQDGAQIAFSEAAFTTHHSDHESLEIFLRRAFLYGVYDSRIAQKHPQLPAVSPWAFLAQVNPISRPFLLFAVRAPRAAETLARAAMALSSLLARAGLEALALRGTTLVYGMQYFRGVREEAGSRARAQSDLADHRRAAG